MTSRVRVPKKRWMLAVIGWSMLGSVLIYLQYKLDYRGGGSGGAGNGNTYGAWTTTTTTTTEVAVTVATKTQSIVRRRTTNTSGDGADDINSGNNAGTATSSLEMPYLPAEFLPLDRSDTKRRFNETCAILPTLFDLKINNVYWQHLVTDDGSNVYLYGAYYDNRSLTEGHPQVRILSMTDRIPPPNTFCHFWFEGESTPSFSSNVTTYHYMWHPKRGNSKNGTLQPILLNCPMPPQQHRSHPAPPVVVSLVERICDNATNALKVVSTASSSSSSKDDEIGSNSSASIAVCVKGLNYLQEDRSVRLVEWLELLRILGVDRVFMYELSVHRNMSKVFRHYERQGFVDMRPLTLPGDQMNEPRLRALYLAKRIIHKRQNELIPYNDCLYRNLGRYDYVALLDIDEVIVPMAPNVITWQQLIRVVDNSSSTSSAKRRRASLCAQHVYFFDNVTSTASATTTTTTAHNSSTANHDKYPSYLHMLSHVHRARNFTKPWQYVKCLHDTRQVLTLHNHFPMACGFRPLYECPILTMDVHRHGRLHHYRKGCTIGLEDVCAKSFMSDTVVDNAILQYGEDLAFRSNTALRTLGFLT